MVRSQGGTARTGMYADVVAGGVSTIIAKEGKDKCVDYARSNYKKKEQKKTEYLGKEI